MNFVERALVRRHTEMRPVVSWIGRTRRRAGGSGVGRLVGVDCLHYGRGLAALSREGRREYEPGILDVPEIVAAQDHLLVLLDDGECEAPAGTAAEELLAAHHPERGIAPGCQRARNVGD